MRLFEYELRFSSQSFINLVSGVFSLIVSAIIVASTLSSGATIYCILLHSTLSVQSSFFIPELFFAITALAHDIIVFVDL
jgi:hypothetical protein